MRDDSSPSRDRSLAGNPFRRSPRATLSSLAAVGIVSLLVSACFSSEAATGIEGECEETRIVRMTDDSRFDPACIRIQTGDTVLWTNPSGLAHTVTADPDLATNPRNVALPTGADSFHSGVISSGAEFAYTFTAPGRYDYVCLPHEGAGMLGTVIVEE